MQCPDDGACHHGCETRCWRVGTCAPLSAAKYPGDRWPDDIVAAHAAPEDTRVEDVIIGRVA